MWGSGHIGWFGFFEKSQHGASAVLQDILFRMLRPSKATPASGACALVLDDGKVRILPINQNAERFNVNQDGAGSVGCFFHCLCFLLQFLSATADFVSLCAADLLVYVTDSLQKGTDTMSRWRATVYARELANGLAPDSYVTLEHVQAETLKSDDPAFTWVKRGFDQLDMLLVTSFKPLSDAVRAMFDQPCGPLERIGFLILCESKYSVLLKSASGYMHFDSHTFSPCFLDSCAACEPRLQTEAATPHTFHVGPESTFIHPFRLLTAPKNYLISYALIATTSALTNRKPWPSCAWTVKVQSTGGLF